MTGTNARTARDTWTTVQDETQVKFESDGDVFTGFLTALDQNSTIPQAHFTGTGEYEDGEYFANTGRELLRKLSKIPLGSEVRITRTGTIDTGQKSPMVTFEVNYR